MVYKPKEQGPLEILIEIVKDLFGGGKNKPTIFH